MLNQIIGTSAKMQQVHTLIKCAADSDLTILVTGETGTGKELVARAIHNNSHRRGNRMLELNCGAVPNTLLASTIFGHKKGTFTDAQDDRAGLFEEAEGGTALLDEIGELSDEAQVHLLRVLQERQVQRLGEFGARPVDVRVIASTNKDLQAQAESGHFRTDLYYRLSVFPIHLPALRERPDDIPLLAQTFLDRANSDQKKSIHFAPGVLEALKSYHWPGNVRELQNEIDRAVALVQKGEPIHLGNHSEKIPEADPVMTDPSTHQLGYTEALNQFRKQLIEETLEKCDGNRSEAARQLKMNRSNLVSLIRRLGLNNHE